MQIFVGFLLLRSISLPDLTGVCQAYVIGTGLAGRSSGSSSGGLVKSCRVSVISVFSKIGLLALC